MSDVEPTEVVLDEPTEPAPKPRARTVGLLIGLIAVVAGAAFAGLALSDDSGTPEDPVRALLQAIDDGDVLGALEQLEPGERDALRDPISDLVDELNRLEILDADLRDIQGVQLSFDDIELASDVVRPGVAQVRITGGTGQFLLDASELPLGAFIRDLLPDEGIEDATDTSDLASDGFVATVKRGDRWYVSVGYSLAEQARQEAGVEDLPPGIEAAGADSPEEAVRAMVEAGTSFDVRRAVSLLSPGEFGALQEYGGLLDLDEVEAPEDAEVEVTTLDLDSDVSGDHATVFVRKAEFSATVGDQHVSFEGGCFTYDETKVCPGDDATKALEGLGSTGMFGGIADVEPPKLSFDGEQPPFGIATVKVDGKWYVSPIRTMLDTVVLTARMFEPGDLREMKRYVTDVFEAMQEGFTTGFGELGEGFGEEMQAYTECMADATADLPEDADETAYEDAYAACEALVPDLMAPTTTTTP